MTRPRRLPLSRRIRESARNALELAKYGRFGDDYGAPFEVVHRDANHRLRRYATGAPPDAPVALLVPPLMVTAEVYDIAPDVSAVGALGALGVEPWVVDFGAPEREVGGMKRSLDDHVRAVVSAVDRVRQSTGRDVHLCGYSQGGMFAYQAAAYRRGDGIASIVTFGSPVDVHKSLPAVRADITGALARTLRPALVAAMSRIEGLPGKVTSTAFKLVSTRKELQQRVDFVRMLHDRERLARQEARRRFLGGAGFVAWPGPAFRVFVEEFIVHNRMLSGGFVIDGRTVSLADLKCPILAFSGETDEIARPPTIRAISDAAPDADVRFVSVHAGHFGIVVGSRAMQITWPTVAQWIHWLSTGGPLPDALAPRREPTIDDDMEPADFEVDIELFFDTVGRSVRSAWDRLGDAVAGATDTVGSVRWQEPRLRRLASMEPGTRVSPSLELAERARSAPEATFFLWKGRAFSYADADTRVGNVARGLWACGVRPKARVGVVMATRPSLLSASTALGRLGAVSVIAPRDASPEALRAAFERLDVTRVVVDPENAARCRALGCEVLVLGGGPGRDVPEGTRDMEAIEPAAVVLPDDLVLDPGRASDLAFVLLRPSDDGELRAVPVTNHRWALSAIGAAAACTVKPTDTVYCAVPLHHPTGMLVSVGAALAGGARLALGEEFDPKRFITEVRRTGSTIVFYAGEMLHALLDEPVSRGDRHLPVRLVAGSGMRPALAERLRERFGFGTMEFYAGTAHRAILADPSGEKPGALGRVLPGSAEVALVRCDLESGALARSPDGRLVLADANEPALLAARVAEDELATLADHPGLVRDALEPGDAWIVTSDVVRCDEEGDHWFVDALSGFVRTNGGTVSTREIEDALYAIPEIQLAAAWAADRTIDAAFVSREPLEPSALDAALEALPEDARPRTIARLAEIPLTEGFRPRKRALPSREPLERYRLIAGRYAR